MSQPSALPRARPGIAGYANAQHRGPRWRLLLVLLTVLAGGIATIAGPADATHGSSAGVVMFTNDDFRHGTFIIDQPGNYRLAEDISFNPNSPSTLTADVADGTIPDWLVNALGLPTPVDAYHSGFPLFTQFAPGGVENFTPGGPLDARYDPAAYGVGFFAAISITADDVMLDLNGHTIEQSAEHALLQRFFAVIELADQPFVPAQGPFDFGTGIDAAQRVTIRNGTIGRSAHHGIHGNGNQDVTISNVDFVDYEVAAVALNGVQGLDVRNVSAVNRKDVPVLGTFSSAQFIKHFVDELARGGSATSLTVDGTVLDVGEIQSSLMESINNTHADIIIDPNVVGGRAQIDSVEHAMEYGLFHNPYGVVDGNSYSFLVNSLGVAVSGFPYAPDGIDSMPSQDVRFTNVHVVDQVAAITEIPAIDAGGTAAIDPIGAVFQIHNRNPDSGEPVTVSSTDPSRAIYTGNPVANAQAFVAKAYLDGEFDGSHLNASRLNISNEVLSWIEESATLEDADFAYLCNGDSMFHVNKGVIGFKIDAARDVRLTNTSVDGLQNLGHEGSALCDDYIDGFSHPGATLPGYGGSVVRAYTFAGTQDAVVIRASASGMTAGSGSAIGFDVLTDSSNIWISGARVSDVHAGWYGPVPDASPTDTALAYGFHIGGDAGAVTIRGSCASRMVPDGDDAFIHDETGNAWIAGSCRSR